MHGPTIGCVIDIPDALIATQSKYNGEAGRAFVAALPGLAGRFLGEWGLRRDGATMTGCARWCCRWCARRTAGGRR